VWCICTTKYETLKDAQVDVVLIICILRTFIGSSGILGKGDSFSGIQIQQGQIHRTSLQGEAIHPLDVDLAAG
jgi:hypothetical protein